MQDDNIAIRLKFLISELGINSSVFADNCGISRATLSQLLTGRNKKISDVLIGQIHRAYPDLSILWLLFNEGDMWMNKNSEAEETDLNVKNTNDALDNSSRSVTQDISSNNPSENGDNRTPPYAFRKNPSENLKFPDDGQHSFKFPEENRLNTLENTHQDISSQQINSYINTAGLISEIENLRSKIKKVVQITIYYDDSTFETFYPK